MQFIKRFFVTNSVMSYHPKKMLITALFFATKSESTHLQLTKFCKRMSTVPGMGDVTSETVLAPEFLLVQGLRFCFDVRHPHRALKGLYLELMTLQSIARGDNKPDSWKSSSSLDKAVKELQKHLLEGYGPPTKFVSRIEAGYHKARSVLARAAVLSDSYFLYTPSQIAFAALHIADRKLVDDLLYAKSTFAPDIPDEARQRPSVDRIRGEIEACAACIRKAEIDDDAAKSLRKEAARIDKKLRLCQDPEKLDLVELNKAQKRDAENGAEQKEAKRRKLENQRKVDDDVFGPSLTAVKKESG